MKFILAPARNMKNKTVDIHCTKPLFEEETHILLRKLREHTPWELEEILKTNQKLAFKAFDDILSFDFANQGVPATFTYDGLVYRHLAPLTLSKSAIERSQSIMCIVSAFYGLLRPLDGILPYRLEMRSGLTINGKNLYDFWGDKLYRSLFNDDYCVVNLASEEYAGVIRKHLRSNDSFIDMVFQTAISGRLKMVATTTAKMARGQMARYILENNIDDPEALKTFEWGGLAFEKSLSYQNRYVFIQK